MQSSGFETIVFLAWRIGILCLVVCLLLFFITIAWRYYNLKIQARTEEFKQLWLEILINSLDEIPRDLPEIEKANQNTFLVLWNHLKETLKAETSKNLNVIVRKTGMDFVAVSKLSSRKQDENLLAINTLGWLKEENCWSEIEKFARHKETSFSLIAAKALIRINPERAVPVIVRLMVEREDWATEAKAEIIRNIEVERFEETFLEAVWQASDEVKPGLIKLFNLLTSEKTAPFVEKFLTEFKDTEIILAGLLVFKDVDKLDLVRGFLSHNVWQVRMAAAVCLGNIGTKDDVKTLTQAVNDREWWVRYHSARALAKLPTMTSRKLKNIAKKHPNEFSRDIIQRVIGEREATGLCGLNY